MLMHRNAIKHFLGDVECDNNCFTKACMLALILCGYALKTNLIQTSKPTVLKEFSQLLAGPVAAIYNSSLREGHVPRIWRAAYVSPLPKKKPPEHIETDLRPISLTAVLCKEMEEFVVKWVWDIVQIRVDPNQYGSIKKSSTTHALVDLLHQCCTSTDAS